MSPDTFQHMDGPHHVRFVGIDRLLIACAHDRLRCQMQHDLRPCFVKDPGQMRQVPDIPDNAAHFSRDARQGKQIRGRRRFQGISGENGSGVEQRPAHPGAFEPRVSCYQDPFVVIKAVVHQSAHTFQGALPSSHIFSSISFSRSVSMHCQNPV